MGGRHINATVLGARVMNFNLLLSMLALSCYNCMGFNQIAVDGTQITLNLLAAFVSFLLSVISERTATNLEKCIGRAFT